MPDWNASICNEKSGFLFAHRCDRAPTGRCLLCDKPICEEHSHAYDDGEACTTCRRKRYRRGRGRGNRGRDDYVDDDPFFYGYGGYGYGGYGYGYHHRHRHDEHDFTEADGESFAEAGDVDFESDMTES